MLGDSDFCKRVSAFLLEAVIGLYYENIMTFFMPRTMSYAFSRSRIGKTPFYFMRIGQIGSMARTFTSGFVLTSRKTVKCLHHWPIDLRKFSDL